MQNILNNNSYHYLGKILAQEGVKIGAEIGVDKGHFSKFLCELIPDLKLFCIDPWLNYPEYENETDQHYFNVNYNNTIKRLKGFNCEIIRKTSMEAVDQFFDKGLDFVYIDANHTYKYVSEDIERWSRKVKDGGIVCGDDYDWYDHKKLRTDVKDAVDEYVKKHNKDLYIIQKGRSKTWFFIK